MIDICLYMHSHVHLPVCCSWSPPGLQKVLVFALPVWLTLELEKMLQNRTAKTMLSAAKTRTIHLPKTNSQHPWKMLFGRLFCLSVWVSTQFEGLQYFSGSSSNRLTGSKEAQSSLPSRRKGWPLLWGNHRSTKFRQVKLGLCQGLYCWSNMKWHEP